MTNGYYTISTEKDPSVRGVDVTYLSPVTLRRYTATIMAYKLADDAEQKSAKKVNELLKAAALKKIEAFRAKDEAFSAVIDSKIKRLNISLDDIRALNDADLNNFFTDGRSRTTSSPVAIDVEILEAVTDGMSIEIEPGLSWRQAAKARLIALLVDHPTFAIETLMRTPSVSYHVSEDAEADLVDKKGTSFIFATGEIIGEPFLSQKVRVFLNAASAEMTSTSEPAVFREKLGLLLKFRDLSKPVDALIAKYSHSELVSQMPYTATSAVARFVDQRNGFSEDVQNDYLRDFFLDGYRFFTEIDSSHYGRSAQEIYEEAAATIDSELSELDQAFRLLFDQDCPRQFAEERRRGLMEKIETQIATAERLCRGMIEHLVAKKNPFTPRRLTNYLSTQPDRFGWLFKGYLAKLIEDRLSSVVKNTKVPTKSGGKKKPVSFARIKAPKTAAQKIFSEHDDFSPEQLGELFAILEASADIDEIKKHYLDHVFSSYRDLDNQHTLVGYHYGLFKGRLVALMKKCGYHNQFSNLAAAVPDLAIRSNPDPDRSATELVWQDFPANRLGTLFDRIADGDTPDVWLYFTSSDDGRRLNTGLREFTERALAAGLSGGQIESVSYYFEGSDERFGPDSALAAITKHLDKLSFKTKEMREVITAYHLLNRQLGVVSEAEQLASPAAAMATFLCLYRSEPEKAKAALTVVLTAEPEDDLSLAGVNVSGTYTSDWASIFFDKNQIWKMPDYRRQICLAIFARNYPFFEHRYRDGGSLEDKLEFATILSEEAGVSHDDVERHMATTYREHLPWLSEWKKKHQVEITDEEFTASIKASHGGRNRGYTSYTNRQTFCRAVMSDLDRASRLCPGLFDTNFLATITIEDEDKFSADIVGRIGRYLNPFRGRALQHHTHSGLWDRYFRLMSLNTDTLSSVVVSTDLTRSQLASLLRSVTPEQVGVLADRLYAVAKDKKQQIQIEQISGKSLAPDKPGRARRLAPEEIVQKIMGLDTDLSEKDWERFFAKEDNYKSVLSDPRLSPEAFELLSAAGQMYGFNIEAVYFDTCLYGHAGMSSYGRYRRFGRGLPESSAAFTLALKIVSSFEDVALKAKASRSLVALAAKIIIWSDQKQEAVGADVVEYLVEALESQEQLGTEFVVSLIEGGYSSHISSECRTVLSRISVADLKMAAEQTEIERDQAVDSPESIEAYVLSKIDPDFKHSA